jgi:acetyl-CoA carboxylase carboxyl transferase subunit alpha
LRLVDAVIPEPLGGAQRDPAATMKAVDAAVWEALVPLLRLDGAMLRAQRREKFLDMGRDALL